VKLPDRIDAKRDVMMGKHQGNTHPGVFDSPEDGGRRVQRRRAGLAYPQISPDDLKACLEYAAALADEEVVLTEA
jgi:hypothetical protein